MKKDEMIAQQLAAIPAQKAARAAEPLMSIEEIIRLGGATPPAGLCEEEQVVWCYEVACLRTSMPNGSVESAGIYGMLRRELVKRMERAG